MKWLHESVAYGGTVLKDAGVATFSSVHAMFGGPSGEAAIAGGAMGGTPVAVGTGPGGVRAQPLQLLPKEHHEAQPPRPASRLAMEVDTPSAASSAQRQRYKVTHVSTEKPVTVRVREWVQKHLLAGRSSSPLMSSALASEHNGINEAMMMETLTTHRGTAEVGTRAASESDDSASSESTVDCEKGVYNHVSFSASMAGNLPTPEGSSTSVYVLMQYGGDDDDASSGGDDGSSTGTNSTGETTTENVREGRGRGSWWTCTCVGWVVGDKSHVPKQAYDACVFLCTSVWSFTQCCFPEHTHNQPRRRQ